MPSTYGRTRWRGIWACGCMIQSIEEVIEPRLREAGYLGADQNISITQGCYSGAVSASAGTHDGGGAIDIRKTNDAETVIWRECGVALWQRGKPEDPYFSAHSHGVWQGCPHLSGGAARQVVSYKNGKNGLAGNGPDKSPHVAPVTWQVAYHKYIETPPEGLLGMTDVERFTGAAPQKIARDGKWKTVKLNEDGAISYLSGPKELYVVVTFLQLAGLGVGEAAQVRYIAVTDYPGDKATVTDSAYPIKEIIGTSGSSFDQIVWLNDLGKSKDKDGTTKLRLQILAPSEPDPSKPLGPVTIEKLVARVTY